MQICPAIHKILVNKAFTVTDGLTSQLFVATFVHLTYMWIALIWSIPVQLSLWKSVYLLWRYKLNKVCNKLIKCQVWFTPEWKSVEWTRRWADLWNNLGFSLYAMPSVCCVVATSDDREKSKMKVSANWCVAVEYWRSSLIRDYLCQLSD